MTIYNRNLQRHTPTSTSSGGPREEASNAWYVHGDDPYDQNGDTDDRGVNGNYARPRGQHHVPLVTLSVALDCEDRRLHLARR